MPYTFFDAYASPAGQLSADCLAGDLIMSLVALPTGITTLAAGDWFQVAITAPDLSNPERVLVTAFGGGGSLDWTIERGQGETNDVDHFAGDWVWLIQPAAAFLELQPPSSFPTTSAVGDSSSPGTGSRPSKYDHRHGREAFATPTGLGNANAAGSASTIPHSDHVHKRDILVSKAGTNVGTRNKLNLIEGSNVTITAADNSGSDRIDVTIASATPGMSNPMTTLNDLIVGGSSGAPARLAKGSDGMVLTVDPTTHNLVWATPTGGMTNPMTTAGDLILGGSSGTPTRLAKGTASQVLTIDPSTVLPVWAASTGGGGGGGVSSEALASGNTALNVNSTWFDVAGCSLSLPAGTWVIIGQARGQNGASTATSIFLAVHDGTNRVGDARSTVGISNDQNLVTIARVTLAATTTVKLQAMSDNNTGASIQQYATGTEPATRIIAISPGVGDQSITSRMVTLTVSSVDVATQEGTSSTTYTNLATSGPAITLSPGVTQNHLLVHSASSFTNAASVSHWSSVSYAGAAATDADGQENRISGICTTGRQHLLSAQTSGATHTMKYRTASSTGNWYSRRLTGVAL